jgi:hypothetical protein
VLSGRGLSVEIVVCCLLEVFYKLVFFLCCRFVVSVVCCLLDVCML